MALASERKGDVPWVSYPINDLIIRGGRGRPVTSQPLPSTKRYLRNKEGKGETSAVQQQGETLEACEEQEGLQNYSKLNQSQKGEGKRGREGGGRGGGERGNKKKERKGVISVQHEVQLSQTSRWVERMETLCKAYNPTQQRGRRAGGGVTKERTHTSRHNCKIGRVHGDGKGERNLKTSFAFRCTTVRSRGQWGARGEKKQLGMRNKAAK